MARRTKDVPLLAVVGGRDPHIKAPVPRSRHGSAESLCESVMAGSLAWTYLLFPDMHHWPDFWNATLRTALLEFLSSEREGQEHP